MERSPEQLSLTLFEPDSEQRHRPEPHGRARAPKPTHAVAPSRTLAPPVASGETSAPSSSPGPALLTTGEAADVLRVHPRTVQRLVERGQLEAIHLGAAVRFDPQDVADLTVRLKRPARPSAAPAVDVIRPNRPLRISFADRLRSQRHEHRARPA
jgi:excisionase family DNA binding protein